MSRVKAVFKPTDYPYALDSTAQAELDALFGYLFPNNPDPEIDQSHVGVAIAAQNPVLALQLAKLSRFIALELPWCQRQDLRELIIQTVNVHFGCNYGFKTRLQTAEKFGISTEQQHAIATWEQSKLFDDEQRLILEYTSATVRGRVPDALFEKVSAAFGEKGAIEMTSVVGFWSFWAMFLNSTYPSSK